MSRTRRGRDGAAAGNRSTGARRSRAKFLRFFPAAFRDETYIAWERDYKWQAHLRWRKELDKDEFRRLLRSRAYAQVASRALSIESRTNLLFSFEKMAIRDAVKQAAGARAFAEGLYEFLHGGAASDRAFDRWCEVVAGLPRRQTRVLTWPVVTVFPFIARPARHFFLKPMVTRRAAVEYGTELAYAARPSAEIYAGILDFARQVRGDLRDLRPRDMIDVQSFLWVLGSGEYEESGKHDQDAIVRAS